MNVKLRRRRLLNWRELENRNEKKSYKSLDDDCVNHSLSSDNLNCFSYLEAFVVKKRNFSGEFLSLTNDLELFVDAFVIAANSFCTI